MQTIDTLLQARWIVPIEPEGQVLEHHSLALHDGRILEILPTEHATQRYSAAETVILPDHVLLPGLVNTHTHAAMTLLRGVACDMPLMTWLNEHIWPTEVRWVSPEFVHAGTELAVLEMLRGGTTCFNDMYFFPDVTAECAERLGVRAVVGLVVIDFPSAWAKDADDYLAKGLALHQQLRTSPLVSTMLAPHAPYTVSESVLVRIREIAEQYDLRIHMHIHETASEVDMWQLQHGERPLASLDRWGLLSPRLLATHMTQLTEAEIERFAAVGGHVLHCPESSLKLASGFCPVAKLKAAGINVALGTDGAASNNDLDMFGEARTAALLGKGVAGDAAALPAPQVLSMATLGGARALGLDSEIGSLVPGKAADIIAVDLATPETEPIYHGISQLIYSTARQQVTDVWVAGQRRIAERHAVGIDSDAILTAARAWASKIKSPH